MIDLEAKIIPGVGAGGIMLSTKEEEFDQTLLASFELEQRVSGSFHIYRVYRSRDIILYFRDGVLEQIGLVGNYNGKLNSGLGLGSLVRDFEKVYGKMAEGPEDELIFSNLNGMWFEVEDSRYNSDNWTTVIPGLPVTEIYVFRELVP